MDKIRIDLHLINKNYCKTRSQAQQLIEFGYVSVNNKTITTKNFLVSDSDNIIVQPAKYVSRGGLKLEKAINEFAIDLKNKIILDIGASKGGFTDCCLKHKAKLVYAIDVGNNQLDNSLKNNSKVISYENTNIKDIDLVKIDYKIDLIVADVSFISLKHVFNSIQKFKKDNCKIIFLIKPQFELDKKIIDKFKGSIKSQKYRDIAINNVISYANQYNMKLSNIITSPIVGNKKQNIEYLGLFEWKK